MIVENIEKCNNAKWKKVLKCNCVKVDGVNVNLDSCKFCTYTERENSIPKNDFKTVELDENENEVERTVSKVKLVLGKDDDVIGWEY